MSATEPHTSSAPDPDASRHRLDEDDHDLLTFGEASERLRIEIAAASTRLADLEQAATSPEFEHARDRLAALRSAASRNAAQPINDQNFEKFFGYPGTARRSLPGPTIR